MNLIALILGMVACENPPLLAEPVAIAHPYACDWNWWRSKRIDWTDHHEDRHARMCEVAKQGVTSGLGGDGSLAVFAAGSGLYTATQCAPGDSKPRWWTCRESELLGRSSCSWQPLEFTRQSVTVRSFAMGGVLNGACVSDGPNGCP